MKDDRARALFGDFPLAKLERFKKWNEINPHVYKIFAREARKMKATGKTFYSGYTLFYHMRFEVDLETKGDPFKINNDFIPIYVRLLIYRRPEFEDWFDLREIDSKNIMSAEERRRREEGDYLH